MSKNLKIGITGGIGAGKSIVSNFIEAEGFTVLRSDLIAKDLMQNDETVRKKLIQVFGEQTLLNGKLNTKFLAENVFNNRDNLEKINSIVHPPAIQKLEEKSKEILKKQNLVFIESALIYEAHIEEMFDYIILVYSDEGSRKERAKLRDKNTYDQIKTRMQFQISDEKKRDKADFVIENNGTTEQLKIRTKFVLNLLTSLTK